MCSLDQIFSRASSLVFVLISFFNCRGARIGIGEEVSGRTVAHGHRRTACSNRRP